MKERLGFGLEDEQNLCDGNQMVAEWAWSSLLRGVGNLKRGQKRQGERECSGHKR